MYAPVSYLCDIYQILLQTKMTPYAVIETHHIIDQLKRNQSLCAVTFRNGGNPTQNSTAMSALQYVYLGSWLIFLIS